MLRARLLLDVDMELPFASVASGSSRAACAFDPRLKLVLLVTFSVAAFAASAWTGMAVLAVLVAACVASSAISPLRLMRLSTPLFIILAIILVTHSFVIGVESVEGAGTVAGPGMGATAAGAAADGSGAATAFEWPVAFSPEGSLVGLFYVVRIWLLFLASFIVVLTTESELLMRAFASLLSPLRVLRVPVDDVALVLSLAMRFIPLAFDSFGQIKRAQMCRGARFDTGSLVARFQAGCRVLLPLVVQLFRRADAVGEAMGARCYGAKARRTSLVELHVSLPQCAFAALAAAVCVAATVL